ncbi:hypothetical protein [Haloprofundus salinisoli]|uniref:hypothetical protein n=1 Tax=Haloprofundus salinisoli TaxID=2876193 RepID=UPI001CCFF128|nr:hypothetical protein [Haloprofundus salinisoli]
MVGLGQGDKLEVTINRVSKKDNAIVFLDGGEKHINLGKINHGVGETVEVEITRVCGHHYYARLASVRGKSFKASKSPSVGKTRSMDSSDASVHERDFDPRTYGAPEINRPEPKWYEVSEEVKESEARSSAPNMASLAEIAQNCDEPFTEKREKEARVCIRKREWHQKPPLDVSKKP